MAGYPPGERGRSLLCVTWTACLGQLVVRQKDTRRARHKQTHRTPLFKDLSETSRIHLHKFLPGGNFGQYVIRTCLTCHAYLQFGQPIVVLNECLFER